MVRISKSIESAKKKWSHLSPNQREKILNDNDCNPYDMDELWDDFYPEMTSDYQEKLVRAFGDDDLAEKGLGKGHGQGNTGNVGLWYGKCIDFDEWQGIEPGDTIYGEKYNDMFPVTVVDVREQGGGKYPNEIKVEFGNGEISHWFGFEVIGSEWSLVDNNHEKGLNRLSEAVVNELWRLKGMDINESTDGDVLKAIKRVSRRKAEALPGAENPESSEAAIVGGATFNNARRVSRRKADGNNDYGDIRDIGKIGRISDPISLQPSGYKESDEVEIMGVPASDIYNTAKRGYNDIADSGVGRAVRGVVGKIGDVAGTVLDTGKKIGSGLEGLAGASVYHGGDVGNKNNYDNGELTLNEKKSIRDFSIKMAYNMYNKKGNSMFGMLDGDVLKAVRRKADEGFGPGNQQGVDDFKTWEGPMSMVATFDPNEYPPQQGPGNAEGAYVNMHMQNPQTIGEGLMSRYGINDANSGELKINNDVDNYYSMESPEHAKIDQKMDNDIRDANDLNGTNYKVDGPDTRNKPKSMRRRIRR